MIDTRDEAPTDAELAKYLFYAPRCEKVRKPGHGKRRAKKRTAKAARKRNRP